jgi:hypothetical protein
VSATEARAQRCPAERHAVRSFHLGQRELERHRGPTEREHRLERTRCLREQQLRQRPRARLQGAELDARWLAHALAIHVEHQARVDLLSERASSRVVSDRDVLPKLTSARTQVFA